MFNNLNKHDLWIVGAGLMAQEYAKILLDQKVAFTVVGRSEKSAGVFFEKTGERPLIGGVEKAIQQLKHPPQIAIVTVNIECLQAVTLELLALGVKKILLEKPAGLNYGEVAQLLQATEKAGAEVLVAYNRRFYASVQKAREMIALDGGVRSFDFEFTEWSHRIETLNKPAHVFESWFFANSSHVVDLAFFLGGAPCKLVGFTAGGTSWYPNASVFSGAGVTETNALFTYKANWKSAGRWSVEILTDERKLILCPLEQLKQQKRGTIVIEDVAIDDTLDQKFKPGLFLQTTSFLKGDYNGFATLQEHHKMCGVYDRIEHPQD